MLYPNFNELVALKDQKSHLTLAARQSVKSTVPGDHHSPFRGQGLEFDAVQKYVPGDDVRNIDWRVTARSGSPHIKLFKEERERNVMICIDMNHTMRFGTRHTFKSIQAARAAAFLGWRALANHDRVGACLFGDVSDGLQFFAPKRTRLSLWKMLTLLTKPPANHQKVSLEEFLKHMNKAAHTGSLIFIISDFMDLSGHLEAYLSRLNKRCDVLFIAINDFADMAFQPVGTLAFQADDRENIFVNTDSIAGREAYAAQWEKNRNRLSEIAAKFKVAHIALTTESDIQRDLILGLKQVAKRRGR